MDEATFVALRPLLLSNGLLGPKKTRFEALLKQKVRAVADAWVPCTLFMLVAQFCAQVAPAAAIIAARAGKLRMLKYIIERRKIDVNATVTCSFCALCYVDDMAVAAALSPQAHEAKFGHRPVHSANLAQAAACGGFHDVLSFLVSVGANMNTYDPVCGVAE